jgi:hypothetical protein
VFRSIGVSAVLALLLSGCSPSTDGVSLGELEHVHSVATNGEAFFLASHHGLHVWSGESWQLRGEEFDIMGLAIDDGVFYASGHPGPTQDLPNPLGILVSQDAGETWEPDVLTGEVDFHLLETAANTMLGVAANYGLVVASPDRGETWTSLEAPPLTSLSLNPANGDEILLASDGLLLMSVDAGATFTPTAAPPGVFLIDWSDSNVYLATDSTIYRSSTPSGPYVALSQEFTNVLAIAAHDRAVIVLDDQGVHVSQDNGESFTLLP